MIINKKYFKTLKDAEEFQEKNGGEIIITEIEYYDEIEGDKKEQTIKIYY
jgi:hypothetical protein